MTFSALHCCIIVDVKNIYYILIVARASVVVVTYIQEIVKYIFVHSINFSYNIHT